MKIKKTVAAVLPLIMSTGIAADILSSSSFIGHAERTANSSIAVNTLSENAKSDDLAYSSEILSAVNFKDEAVKVNDTVTEDQSKGFGDINKDSIVDGRDATSLLTYYAKASTGFKGSLEEFIGETDTILGDINGDSVIDGSDATSLLTYYAKTSIGYSKSLDIFIGEQTGVNPLTGQKVTISPEETTPANTTVTSEAAVITTETDVLTTSSSSASTTTSAPVSALTSTTTPVSTTANNEGPVIKTGSMYYMWLDISKDKNYVFNDKYLKITFKIKEGIPDGDYEVSFKPDFSSIEGISIIPDKVIQGNIRVGSESIDATDVSGEDGFTAYGDSIACKQGDTVDYYLNLKNNPGLAALLIWFYYDSDAMEVLSVKSCGDFGEISQNGDENVGTRPAKSK